MSTTAPAVGEVLAVLDAMPLFAGVEREPLEEFAAQAVVVRHPQGEELWELGSRESWFQVLIAGAVEWSRDMGGERVAVAVHKPVTFFGAISSLSRQPAKVMARALADATVLRFPGDAFRDLCCADVELLARIVRLTGEVVSTSEGAMRERERLASIGTLAAGLAHEIGNPASAALRQVGSLRAVLGGSEAPVPPGSAPLDPIERADREEELAGWLTAAGVKDPWDTAAALTDAGADLAWCEEIGSATVARSARALGARGLLEELDGELGRIVRLVSTMRDYANLDRAPEQDIEVVDGIRAASLVVGIAMELRLKDDVPRITAYPGELSQLWTELLRNAAQAGPGDVEVWVKPTREGGVHVSLADRGPGIPDEHLGRVWDPFFTTKPGAAGLGLDLARRVVESHRGRILLGERDGGGTVVTVELPG